MSPARSGSTKFSRVISVGAALALAAGASIATTVPAQAATVPITILNVNDFHGRIDLTNPSLTTSFALTIEKLRAEAGDANTLLLSAGDNIGASLFASAVQDDEPTLEVLDALDVAASAVGNHEFDRGFTDLTERVAPLVQFPYLGANVYLKGTTTPALPEYTVIDVAGVDVGVIGAVTQETASLVSPGGIANLDFGDPVAAVNRVAAQLSDGDPANGEADLLVAEYHEGAPTSGPPATLEEQLAQSPVFASIVNDTAPEVDAILTAHTHMNYAWSAPIPGTDRTRPVLQTGSYGDRVGKIVLQADDATGEVTSFTVENVDRGAAPTEADLTTYPRVAQVKTIVDNAIAYATEIGLQPIGSVAADITTAFSGGSYVDGKYAGGSRDDRGKESTLGTAVADALLDILAPAERGGAQLAFVNPGGLRAELLYAPDGVVTYAEANSVLPFVNNLWTTTLTGAQVKTALEQQWQRDADGNVPSRAYLALGMSSNVRYTYDATRAEGDRITGIWVDGSPLDPAGEYRVGSFNFLLQGGDNFRVFAQGSDTRDTGLIDRDGWIAYLQQNPNLAPSFAKSGVQVSGLPPAAVAKGSTLAFTISDLDLTSLGSPANTSLSVAWTGSNASFASVPVTAGSAAVSLVVPADAPANSVLTFTAAPSGTVVSMPVAVLSTSLVNLTPPAISGPAYAGSTVRATPGTWSPSSGLKFWYQFKVNGRVVKSSASPVYAIDKRDVGKSLSVTVTATAKGLKPASATSAAVKIVAKPLVNKVPPKILGKVQYGSTVKAYPGSWSLGGLKFSYQWKLNGKPAAHATKATYSPGKGDVGKQLTVTVTAVAKGQPPVAASSKAVKVLDKPKPHKPAPHKHK